MSKTETRAMPCTASIIKSSGETLLSLINNILDFSKIESGKLEFENLDFSIRDIAETSLEQFKISARKKSIVITGFLMD